MSSPETTALLERSAEQVVVLAPPVEPMINEAGRLRRRRRTVVGGAVLAVVATLGAADAVASFVDPGPEAWPATSPPDGMRWVGVGRAVIAVPSEWPRDATRCGQPVRDTVMVGGASTVTCTGERPAGVRSVAVTSGGPGVGFAADATYDVGGRTVERGRTVCAAGTCSAVVHVPTENVTFTVASSTGRPERARAEVAALARGVRVLDGHVAVPATGRLEVDYGRSAETKYVADLRRIGLEPVVTAERGSGAAPGTVTGVSPEPGTPLVAGSEVRVRVAGGERRPRDKVAVGIGSVDEDRTYRRLTHEDIRRGATLEVPQGTDIWAYADGSRALTLDARTRGSSIAIDFWRNGPNWPTAWEAVQPGTTELTLSIRVDGRNIDLGTVRIVVTE
ncbi:MAG: PASTA domain-containing protein [Nocardioides sp.]